MKLSCLYNVDSNIGNREFYIEMAPWILWVNYINTMAADA